MAHESLQRADLCLQLTNSLFLNRKRIWRVLQTSRLLLSDGRRRVRKMQHRSAPHLDFRTLFDLTQLVYFHTVRPRSAAIIRMIARSLFRATAQQLLLLERSTRMLLQMGMLRGWTARRIRKSRPMRSRRPGSDRTFFAKVHSDSMRMGSVPHR